jgi:hypothetical protein
MNNYNQVFFAIKKYAAIQGMLTGGHCFEVISRESNVSYTLLFPYLTNLQKLGLINYSFEENFIELTEFGQKTEKIFGEDN